MANKVYKSGPLGVTSIELPSVTPYLEKGAFYKAGRLKGFVLTPVTPDDRGMVIQIEGEFHVDFKGTNAVEIGDILEYNSTEDKFEKPATPTDADVIALESHDATDGTLRVLLIPGLKL